jgi:hypothetical protein
LLLLGWSWLEVVFALPSSPHRVGWAIVIFSMAQWIGMGCFGREVWQGHADVFALYFAQLGRLAPVRASPDGRHLILCRPALMSAATARAGEVGFVFAMLATVLFDGLHGSAPWLFFQTVFDRGVPRGFDVNGYIAGGLGMVLVWLCLTLAYGLTCWMTSLWLKTPSATRIAQLFIPALLPIAVGYLVAHNFSGLIIQGQHLLTLASDPLGRQWNLWGTAGRPIDIGLIDAATTWYVALTAIVLGHGVSVWVSHRLALATAPTPAAAIRLCVPLTVLMIGYTALSLAAIAEPLV